MTALEATLERLEETTDYGGFGAGVLAAVDSIRKALVIDREMDRLASATVATPITEIIEARLRIGEAGEGLGLCLRTIPDCDLDTACLGRVGHDGMHMTRNGMRWG